MAVVETTDKTFENDTSKGVTLTDFWATWCGPCRMQSPVVEQLSGEMDGRVTFNKMDVDANDTPQKFGIMKYSNLLVKRMVKLWIQWLVSITPRDQVKAVTVSIR